MGLSPQTGGFTHLTPCVGSSCCWRCSSSASSLVKIFKVEGSSYDACTVRGGAVAHVLPIAHFCIYHFCICIWFWHVSDSVLFRQNIQSRREATACGAIALAFFDSLYDINTVGVGTILSLLFGLFALLLTISFWQNIGWSATQLHAAQSPSSSANLSTTSRCWVRATFRHTQQLLQVMVVCGVPRRVPRMDQVWIKCGVPQKYSEWHRKNNTSHFLFSYKKYNIMPCLLSIYYFLYFQFAMEHGGRGDSRLKQ